MTLKEFSKTWFAYLDAGNFDALKNMVADNHRFHNPMSTEPADGATHLGMMQMMTGGLKGEHIIDVCFSEGEWVCTKGRFTGKHAGDFNGIPATGNEVSFSWIDVMHVVNGKVEEEYLEMNPMAIMQQIGAVPQL